MANHGNKGRPFRLALPRADYCDNSAERKLLTPVKRAEGPKLYVCLCRPPFSDHMSMGGPIRNTRLT